MPPLAARSAGVRRLLQEAAELEADECTDYKASPLEDDLFQWHFTIRGPGGDFEGGVYHGRMVLPSEYPFKPPEIYMATPSGRFEVNRKICLSISSFHPETWQPSWGIRTALLALMAFFNTEAAGAVGSVDAPSSERRRLASASRKFSCATCGFDASSFPAPSAGAEEGAGGQRTESTELVVAAAVADRSDTGSGDVTPVARGVSPDAEDEDVAEPVPDSPTTRHTTPRLSAPPTTIFPARRHGPNAANVAANGGPPSPNPPPSHSHHQVEAPRATPTTVPAPAAAATTPALAVGQADGDRGQVALLPPHARDLASDPLLLGGSPLFVDRAIMCVLLALVACIVRKIA